MAKNVINEKGFKIIQFSPTECRQLGFGFQDANCFELICDNCNELLNNENDIYYVAVLNRALCSKCFEDWYECSQRYKEDTRWETHKYNDIIRRCEVSCIIVEDSNYK